MWNQCLQRQKIIFWGLVKIIINHTGNHSKCGGERYCDIAGKCFWCWQLFPGEMVGREEEQRTTIEGLILFLLKCGFS